MWPQLTRTTIRTKEQPWGNETRWLERERNKLYRHIIEILQVCQQKGVWYSVEKTVKFILLAATRNAKIYEMDGQAGLVRLRNAVA